MDRLTYALQDGDWLLELRDAVISMSESSIPEVRDLGLELGAGLSAWIQASWAGANAEALSEVSCETLSRGLELLLRFEERELRVRGARAKARESGVQDEPADRVALKELSRMCNLGRRLVRGDRGTLAALRDSVERAKQSSSSSS